MQAHGNVLCAARLALDLIGTGQHFLNERDAFFNRQSGAAGVLDVEHLERIAFTQTAVRKPCVELIGFATQAHHHHAPKIGVGGIPCQSAL